MPCGVVLTILKERVRYTCITSVSCFRYKVGFGQRDMYDFAGCDLLCVERGISVEIAGKKRIGG